MELGLKDAIVMISGATGGIGSAICEAFLRENSIIIPLYRNAEKLHLLTSHLVSCGLKIENIFPQETDLGSTASIQSVVKNVISRFGRIDVLVNNAGHSTERPFLLLEEEEWDKEIDVNLNNTARILRIVLKYMFIARKGSVINISSLLAQRYGRGASAYAAAKAGLDRLTQVLAQEVGPKGVRVNSVCPGLIKTQMSKPLIDLMGTTIISQTPLQRFGKPEEIANAVLFLASENCSSFITGHLLRIDGGYGL
jgi:3-oxoacyl-[acyl-carrier protein] reductase